MRGKLEGIMDIYNRKPKIFLIGGKARHGKDTIASYLKECYSDKKVIYSRASKYIKYYAMEMSGWNGSEEDKPRELLQKLGTDIIREKLGKGDMLIQRQIDDLEIYSYFYDVILVPDVKFPIEIESVKERFDNVVTIFVNRINFESPLTKEQQEHITETALSEYKDFDYYITNDTLEKLKEDVYKIYEEEK